jgi:Protein of unknown function (DUF2505)
MRITAQIHYPAEPGAVYAMLVDPAFGERTCLANHALEHEVAVETFDDGGATVTTSRTMPTDQVPDFVRSFIGATLRVTEIREWAAPGPDGARTGTLVVAIDGAPVRLTGTLRLSGTTGTSGAVGADVEGNGARAVQTIDGDLKASVPLVGGRIEKSVEPAIRAAIDVEQRTATDWLAGR